MIYLDTNVLLYATLTKVDNNSQQDKAIKILRELISSKSLVLSSLNILEYVFVMKKAKEDSKKIKSAINLFKTFVYDEKYDITSYLLSKLDNDYAYKNSFDFYHVVFAEKFLCEKILIFDKGFKNFKDTFSIEIDIIKE